MKYGRLLAERAMNIKLRRTIFKVGDEAFGLTKRCKIAKKNMKSFELTMLIKSPLLAIPIIQFLRKVSQILMNLLLATLPTLNTANKQHKHI